MDASLLVKNGLVGRSLLGKNGFVDMSLLVKNTNKGEGLR